SSYFFLHDPPPTEPHPLSLHDALPISGLVQALGLARIAVVAHDIGATVAQPLARHSPDLVSRLVLFDLPYPGIGRRWREPGHAREIWYQIFHTLPWAHELVGANREATRLYLRHFLTHWSGRKGWVTDQELDHWVDAYSQPGALRGGFAYYKAYERVRTTQADAPVETLRVEVPTLVPWA